MKEMKNLLPKTQEYINYAKFRNASDELLYWIEHMKIGHVKIKNWNICCNEILTAITNDSIDLNFSEDGLRLKGNSKDIEYCPFCGKKLPFTFGDVKVLK